MLVTRRHQAPGSGVAPSRAPCPRSARTAGRRRGTPRSGCRARTAPGRPAGGAGWAAAAGPRRSRAGGDDPLAHRVQGLLQRAAVGVGEGRLSARRARPSYDASQSACGPSCRQRASTEVHRIRSSVSGRVVYWSSAKPWNSESVELSSTRSVSPDTTCVPPSSPSVTAAVRTSGRSRAKEWSPSAFPGVLLDGDPGPRTASCVSTKCRASSGRELLDVADAVLAGERVHGVLLGVGRQHRGVVAVEVHGVHVAGQRDGDVEVVQHVPGRVPVDPHQPDLGLAVLVVAQHSAPGHQLPR